MADFLPVWALIPATILFIFVYAVGLYNLLKKTLKTIPVWLPPLLAGLTAIVYASLAPDGPGPEYIVMPMLLLMLTFVIMAVLGAFSFFEGKDLGMKPWIAVGIVSYGAVFLLGLFFFGGSAEMRIGGPAPGFSYRFPLLGMIMDGLILVLNLSSVAYYPPGYGILLVIGLYIEVFLCAAAAFFVMNRAREKKV